MGNRSILLVLLLGAAPLACSSSEPSPEPVVEKTREISTVAVVKNVDLDARKITLEGPTGNRVTCLVGKEVRNLPQVKVGDRVAITYVEAVAVRVVKRTAEHQERVVVERAPEGGQPRGGISREVTLSAEILAIDRSRGSVTLRKGDGEVFTVVVARPGRLTGLNVGDLLSITYAESIALSVEPMPHDVR